MNESPEPSVTAWRIVFYGLLAAIGVAGIGYCSNDHQLYFFAILAGIFICGFGFAIKIGRMITQSRDESERARYKSYALRITKILAIPTAIVGCLLIDDLFISTPEHDTAVVVEKHISTRKLNEVYHLQVKGIYTYQQEVPKWFYDECLLNDTVELSVAPIFKGWHQA